MRGGGIGHVGSPRTGAGAADNTGSYGSVPPGQQQPARVAAAGVPVGFIGPYVGGTAPDGWLMCDGASHNVDTYPELGYLIGPNKQKLVSPVPVALAFLGRGTAVQGDTLAVGAFRQTAGTGYVEVFTRPGKSWVHQQKVEALTAARWFGYAVALDGDTLIAGAPGESQGAAYVFTRSAGVWTQQQRLTASDALASAQFGHSVAISGDSVVIGARQHSSNRGAAYVFTRSAGVWTEQQKFSSAATGDSFGYSVAIQGDLLAIGATGDDAGGNNSGAVYVFTRSAGVWTQQQKLKPSSLTGTPTFGSSVSLDGEVLVAGAMSHSLPGFSFAGAAYVFTRSAGVWTEQQRLTASDPAASAQLGGSVSLSGNVFVAGAEGDAGFRGATYVFERGSNGLWIQSEKLVAPDGAPSDSFGVSVAYDGHTILAGANQNDGAGSEAGAAYVFQDDFSVPDLRGRFPLGVAASGTGSTLGETGGQLDHVHLADPPNTTTGPPSATVAALAVGGSAAGPTSTHDVNIPAFNTGPANPPFVALNFIIKAVQD